MDLTRDGRFGTISQNHFQPVNSAAGRHPAAVAICDPDPDLCRDVQEWLHGEDIQTQIFPSVSSVHLDDEAAGCLLLGLGSFQQDGLELIRVMRTEERLTPVIGLAARHDLAVAVRAMKLGAVDVLEKPIAKQLLFDAVWNALRLHRQAQHQRRLRNAVRARIDGLTGRERQVLDLIITGHSSRNIADKLRLSVKTVDNHRASMMAKMQARRVADLIRIVCEHPSLFAESLHTASSLDRSVARIREPSAVRSISAGRSVADLCAVPFPVN